MTCDEVAAHLPQGGALDAAAVVDFPGPRHPVDQRRVLDDLSDVLEAASAAKALASDGSSNTGPTSSSPQNWDLATALAIGNDIEPGLADLSV